VILFNLAIPGSMMIEVYVYNVTPGRAIQPGHGNTIVSCKLQTLRCQPLQRQPATQNVTRPKNQVIAVGSLVNSWGTQNMATVIRPLN
jgi:hypothetical protein